ncbi:MAG: hypothetical protein ACRDQT_03690, partial [Gaiellaceae bacterium]
KVDEAMPFLVDAHRVQRTVQHRIPDRYSGALLVARFAMALSLKGRARPAAQLLASFDALFEETGVHLDRWIARMNDATLSLVRGRLDEAAFEEARRQGRGLSYEESVALALDELDVDA